jgi:glutathione synthase/RimK-type ligase-like ATP-grasp enzyme
MRGSGVHLAFVTSRTHGAVDPDLDLLLDASRRRDVDGSIAVWDDPAVDWASFDAVVVRSCWDYTDRRDEFLAWASSVPTLHNAAPILQWNTDKTYLRQLQDEGVPIIETRWDVAPGDDIGRHAEWVVKPTISAGSRDTARWSTADEVYAHSAELVDAGRHSMTQPYIASVDEDGETAMLYFGGEFSHAIRKGPLLLRGEGANQDRDSREAITPRESTSAQRELSEHVLATTQSLLGLSAPPLYARIDLVAADDGSPLLIELELAEPSLFLPQSDGGADRLLDALLRA